MTTTLAPTQKDINVALQAFLAGVLPAGMPIVLGQINRVAEPKAGDFIVFWPIRRERLSTNVDAGGDCVFTGSIAGTTLTVTAMRAGSSPIAAGRTLFGVGVLANTVISALLTGTGGIGTYKLDKSQTVASRLLSAGSASFRQATQVTVQIDVHGPAGADNAQTIATLMRDAYAVDAFAASNPNIIPLHADDPRQLPFTNAEQQYEDRWVLEALIQANQTVSRIPLQFADVVEVELIEVDTTYPL